MEGEEGEEETEREGEREVGRERERRGDWGWRIYHKHKPGGQRTVCNFLLRTWYFMTESYVLDNSGHGQHQ